jgi:hypothetical protein
VEEGILLYVKKYVVDEIIGSVGYYTPETGGILGCNKAGMITRFLFDHNGFSTSHQYVPSVGSFQS